MYILKTPKQTVSLRPQVKKYRMVNVYTDPLWWLRYTACKGRGLRADRGNLAYIACVIS